MTLPRLPGLTPAFPVAHPDGSYDSGATLREWYAGLAMQAVASASGGEFMPDHDARIAVRYADALLKALSDPTP